jgi:hypothetical protein
MLKGLSVQIKRSQNTSWCELGDNPRWCQIPRYFMFCIKLVIETKHTCVQANKPWENTITESEPAVDAEGWGLIVLVSFHGGRWNLLYEGQKK